MNNTNGGPAFPRPSSEAVDTSGNHFWPAAQEGMSLRDYFAAAALTGLLAYSRVNHSTPESIAQAAFVFADAMIRARKGGL